MRIHVLQCDIDAAAKWAADSFLTDRSRTQNCPIAQALRRTFGQPVAVGFDSFFFSDFGDTFEVAENDIRTVQTITNMDNHDWRRVVPFSFEVLQGNDHPILPQPVDSRS